MRKKTLALLISLLSLSLFLGLGHRSLISCAVKSYIKARLPEGEKVEFSYTSLRWNKGGLTLHGASLMREEGKESLGFSLLMEDITATFDWHLLPFTFSPRILLDQPHLTLKGRQGGERGEPRRMYPLLDALFFHSPITIQQGTLSLGDQVAVVTFRPAEGEEKGLLQVEKEGSSPPLHVTFSKQGHNLQFSLRCEELDLGWALALGKVFLPPACASLLATGGTVQGGGELSLAPAQEVEHLRYDFTLNGCTLHHEEYGVAVALERLHWAEDFHAEKGKEQGKVHPIFGSAWPYLSGEGQVEGMSIELADSQGGARWKLSGGEGTLSLSQWDTPLIELHGTYCEGEDKAPFAFTSVGKMEGSGLWKIVFDAHLFLRDEVQTSFSLASKGGGELLFETECKNVTPHQVNLCKYIFRSLLPAADVLSVERGVFSVKGVGRIAGSKLQSFTCSQMKVADLELFLPTQSLNWRAREVTGEGTFDFSSPNFCDGTFWELAVTGGQVSLQGEEAVSDMQLSLAMHNQYVKPSTFHFTYQGYREKMAFEGLYTHLNIQLESLAPAASGVRESPLPLSLAAKVKVVDRSLTFDGALSLVGGEKEVLTFGLQWDINQLKRRAFREGLIKGWFQGERVPDQIINLPFIFLGKECRAEGEIGVVGKVHPAGLQLTIDPTHVAYRSQEVDIDPQMGGAERAPRCIFFYDFCKGVWEGTIPLQGVRLQEHSFGMTFDSFTSAVQLEGESLLFQNVDAVASQLRFQAEIAMHFGASGRGELIIDTYAIEGRAEHALTFLRHFEMFQGVDLPLQGALVSGPGEMHLRAYLGDVKKLLEWKIALRFSQGKYPFSPTLGFENLAGELYYSADEKRFVVEQVAGTLSLTAGTTPRSYELNVPLLEMDADEGILVYDCRLEAPTHEICRFVGTGTYVGEEFSLAFDRDRTRLYGALIDVKALTFAAGRLHRAELETNLSALDLVHHLDFLSSAGIIPLQDETLAEMRGPSVQGELSLQVRYNCLETALSFHARSEGLSMGPIELDHLAIQGARKGDHFQLDRFDIGALSVLGEMKREGTKWKIPSVEVIWKKSFLKSTGGIFDQQGKYCTFPIEGLRVDLGEIKDLFPNSGLHWDYLVGTLFATGEALLDFSRGLQSWFLDSHIKVIGEDFGKGKLLLESSEVLNIAYHPSSGFSMGDAGFHFLHPKSNQLWAKCHFGHLNYCRGTCRGKETKITIPPEMLAFLGQKHALPHMEYAEERLVIFGYPLQWDNQMEATFDFSLGQTREVKGSFKDGYYWIGAKAWSLNDCFFAFKDTQLALTFNTAYEEIPLQVAARLSFLDRFRSRFEVQERTETGQEESPLVVVTNWNDAEGFFIQTIEGGVCGLDFSFHHSPKNSYADKMALAGQLKVDVPRLAPLLPQGAREVITNFDIGEGYELSGDLVLSKTSLDESLFRGYLKGKNFQLMGSVMETLLSEIQIYPSRIALHQFNLSDVSGIFSAEKIEIVEGKDKKWELFVPKLTVTDFRPSLVKKIGKYPTPMKPLTIRKLHCYQLQGVLGSGKSFTGRGELNFINTFKRENNILDIPFEILGRLGLDTGLLVPVRGLLDFVMIEGRIYLTQLDQSYSEGKRSQFFLSPTERSYLDFEGNLDIHIRMKQYVLLKVTEPFTLHIGGTFEHPKYGLR